MNKGHTGRQGPRTRIKEILLQQSVEKKKKKLLVRASQNGSGFVKNQSLNRVPNESLGFASKTGEEEANESTTSDRKGREKE